VKEALATILKDIISTYERILIGLRKYDAWNIIERILVLVSYSVRLVALIEATEFVILEDGMVTVLSEERFSDFTNILSLIHNLIIV
jgi:hypothetical protein